MFHSFLKIPYRQIIQQILLYIFTVFLEYTVPLSSQHMAHANNLLRQQSSSVVTSYRQYLSTKVTLAFMKESYSPKF